MKKYFITGILLSALTFIFMTGCDNLFKEDITQYELETKEAVYTPDTTSPIVVAKIIIDSLNVKKQYVRTHESLLGDLITDAVKWYVKEKDGIDVDIVLENAGAIRTDTVYYPDHGDTLYLTDVMLARIFPFKEVGVKITLTGQELKSVLERGASGLPLAEGRFLQVNRELEITIDTTKNPQLLNLDESAIVQEGERIVGCKYNGNDISPDATYTVVMSRFVVYSGGDSYIAVINLPGNKKEDLGRYYLNALISYLQHIDAVNNPIQADTIVGRRIHIEP